MKLQEMTEMIMNSVPFNLFLFIRSRRGLWPTGHRTCQFHL